MRVKHMAVALAAVVAAACGSPATTNNSAQSSSTVSPVATTSTTMDVVQRHLKTFRASDLEGVLADYADDAVMFTPNGPIKGKTALRAAFQQFIAEWGHPETKFTLTDERYEGEHGYIVWTAETPANVYEFGVDGFEVKNGKIVAQFFGAKTTPRKK